MLRVCNITILTLFFAIVYTQMYVPQFEVKEGSTVSVPDFKPPKYKVQVTSSVDEDGSFAFAMSGDNNAFSVSVNGGLTMVNMTQMLKIYGQYRFGNISVRFSANEIDGFILTPVGPPYGVPVKVINSILG